MSLINYDLARWSFKKWLGAVLLVFGLHLGFLWFVSAPLRVVANISKPLPRVGIGRNFGNHDELAELDDPMLFAGAHPHGFSGAAWVKKPQRSYAIQTRLPAATYLESEAARSFFRDEFPAMALTAPNVPRARMPRDALAELKDPAVRKSTFRIEGGLESRKLRAIPELPIQQHTDALGYSIVETGVNSEGLVLAARVTGSSGSKSADQQALALAKRLRFEPLSLTNPEGDAKLAWGKLIFEWFAVNSVGTNAPAR